MWVIKLGGSLSYDAGLRPWLDALASMGGGRIIIVPGGGPFADLVRDAQQHWEFDDEAAHRMALLAMQQNGLLLAALCPALLPAESEEDLRAVLTRGRTALWLPQSLTAGNAELEASWNVSSDSIAAWLAQRMNAERLILVKSCSVPPPPVDAHALSAAGSVDRAFPEFARGACFDTLLLEKTQLPRMLELLHGEHPASNPGG